MTAAGSGHDVLIGQAGDTTLTDTGSGHNILIGAGAGGNTIIGSGNDILLSGTTIYDSDASANLQALDSILAEWFSSDSYAHRINKIIRGVGPGHQYKFNSHTIHTDGNASTLSEKTSPFLPQKLTKSRSPVPRPSNNWFLVSPGDHVTKKATETRTTI